MRNGSIHLFRLLGIDVFLSWWWFALPAYVIFEDPSRWVVALPVLLALFVIVLLHEFGHSLACKSVGGESDYIILWPFGGIAFARPPIRAGATLWTIAAGPLVNVVLIPITGAAWIAAEVLQVNPTLLVICKYIAFSNAIMLVFNLLPIYPLDGGQILYSILWMILDRRRGLLIAAWVGLIGAAGICVLALFIRDWWLVVLAILGATQAWGGFQAARRMASQPPPPPPPMPQYPPMQIIVTRRDDQQP